MRSADSGLERHAENPTERGFHQARLCRDHATDRTSEKEEEDCRERGFANALCEPLFFRLFFLLPLCCGSHTKGCKLHKTRFSVFQSTLCSTKCCHLIIHHPSLQHSRPHKLKDTPPFYPGVTNNNHDFRFYLHECDTLDASHK